MYFCGFFHKVIFRGEIPNRDKVGVLAHSREIVCGITVGDMPFSFLSILSSTNNEVISFIFSV